MKSRTENVIRNSSFAMIEQILCSVFSFVTRTIFIHVFGKVYLGFNGLFSDILTLLSLGELGIGTAIIYSMYKPAAENNYEQISALLNFYKRIYMVIGIVLTIVGLVLTPFLDFFISDIPDIPYISYIYLLFLINTTASYFWIYKKSIIIINQENYINSLIAIIISLTQNILQICIIIFTHNYILYLAIQLICTFCNNIAISLYVDRKYIYLKVYKDARISKTTRVKIINNVKAMFASKVSSAVVTSTDNLLISKYVSTTILGLYSNYTLFIGLLRNFFTKVFESLVGSVGNLIATSDKEDIYFTFKKIWFVNFWLVAMSCSGLFCMINPFIDLWIGEDYKLDSTIVIIICLNLYMRLIRNTLLIFLDTYGLFVDLKKKCIAEAIINFIVSLLLVLVFKLGILGVLLGTFISNFTTNFWYEPWILYKKKFKVPLKEYFSSFFRYVLSTLCMVFTLYNIISLLHIDNWLKFIVGFLICLIYINFFLMIVFCRSEEFYYFSRIIKNKVHRFAKKTEKQ